MILLCVIAYFPLFYPAHSFVLNISIFVENDKYELFNIHSRTDINHGTFALANGYTVGQSLHANRELTTSPWKPVREFPTFLKLHAAFRIKTRIS